MFFRILKKDLKRKKTMNIILLLFITLATTFLASSLNNLIAVSGSVDYFTDKAKTPDYLIASYDRGDNKGFINWLNVSKYVDSYDIDRSVIVPNEGIKISRNGKLEEYEATGQLLLQRQPEKYGKVLNNDGEEVTLKDGEIAFTLAEKSKNKLEIGDKIIITLGNVKKEFKIKEFTKDALFGSSMTEMKRTLISSNEFKEYKNCKEATLLNNYYIMSDDTTALEKEFKTINFNSIVNADSSLMESAFIPDMVVPGVLIVVSLCLILIAFLILRFTIVFTLQDDFKEIGIMKAIGLRNFDIKKVYLIKYIAITLIGSLIGCILSFPFGNILLTQSSGNILMESSNSIGLVNVISAILIIIVVLFFCYTSSRKLNKFSAIDAIRNGSNGESFKGKSRLKLRKSRKVKTPLFMALNDILSNAKRFVVLMFVFCIGAILIIIPLNTINTMKDGSIIKLFGIEYSDVFVEPKDMDKYTRETSKVAYIDDMRELEKSFKEDGFDIKLHGELIFRLNFFVKDKEESLPLMTFQSQKKDDNNYNVLKGEMPKLKNEIALTEIAAKKLNLSVGDTIKTLSDDKEEEFIVTGLFESMTNMGQAARVSPQYEVDYKKISTMFPFQGDFQGDGDKNEMIESLKEKYPNHSFKTSSEYVSRYLGGSLDQVDILKKIIVIVVISINLLITILMMKTFIAKEKGEIAMLKSVGFRDRAIRYWQSARITIVLIVAIILGAVLAYVLGPLTVGQIFAMMGVNNIVLKVNPLEVFLLYPVILIALTTVAAYFTAGAVKKVDLKDINNME